jgi:hypothetical protein
MGSSELIPLIAKDKPCLWNLGYNPLADAGHSEPILRCPQPDTNEPGEHSFEPHGHFSVVAVSLPCGYWPRRSARSAAHVGVQEAGGAIQCMACRLQLFDALLEHVLHAGPFLQFDGVAARIGALCVSQRIVIQNLF